MKIKIDEESYFATVDTTWLAMQGECITRSVFVEYPIVKGTTDYFLRVEMPDMTVYDLKIVNNQVVLTNTITAYAAILPLQWIAKDNTGAIIAKSQIIHAVVKDSIDGDSSALPTPEAFQTKYNECIGEMSSIRDEVRTLKEQIDDGVNPEVTQARTDANGTSYATLKERLDSTDENVEKIESVSTELKEDITNVDFRLSDVFDKVYGDPIAVNMINPSNFIVGTLNMQGESIENSTSPYFVTDYIPVENGKTYGITYYNVYYQTRYSLLPNRLVFYNSSKEFVNQSTSYADNDTFATVKVNISGNTGYLKLTAKQSGYVRMQIGINLEKPMMANGDVIEWTDVYREQDVPFAYKIKNGIIDEDNLADELKEKIESGSIGALDTVYKLAFCKVHKKTLHIGDSLTEGYHASNDIRKSMSYPSHMASLAGYDVTNKGHSGITAYGWWNTYKSIDFTGYDAVFIYLGTNGGLTDTIDADTAGGDYNTFASTNTGGYCAIVSKIRDVNPKAKIYIIQYNQTTATSQVTAKIAQKYGCTTLMVTDTSVFNLTDSKFHTDATHYNTIGYWAFACVMLAQLEKYIAEHISEYTDLV